MSKPAAIVQRRLAAIFSADVAGYTRLMSIDEAGTLRLLASHRDITDRLIPRHDGRIANTAGDGILAEFPSAADAVQCALAIQERVGAVNDAVPEERRVSFRIGVHVGEAMVRDGDLFGDAVNVAARMQGLAEPGSVCVSGAAYEYVSTALPLDFEDLGAQQVKNREAPVRAYLVRPAGRLLSRALPPVHRGAISHLARRLHALCHAALMEVTGPEELEPLEFAAVASIHDAPGIDVAQLAERLGIDPATAKRIVKRLAQRGFIESSPQAGGRHPRAFVVTSAGDDLIRRLRPVIRAIHDRIMAPLSERDRETLIELLVRVIKTRDLEVDGDSD